MTKGRKYKFPDPNDYPAKSPAVLCPAGRVLALYNQETGGDAKRISKKVKQWTSTQAQEIGWQGIHFLPEVQSQHGAGCILWNGNKNSAEQIAGGYVLLADATEEEK